MAKADSKQGLAINPKNHPAKTRLLLRNQFCGGDVFEAVVVEWSPLGRVRLRHQNGWTSWLDPPYLVEVLPPPAPVGKIFSGPESDALWESIGEARSNPELRAAVYKLACACQELEELT